MSKQEVPQYDLSWVDRLRTCPFCGEEVEMNITQKTPDAGSLRCKCGYKSLFNPPYDLDPLKGVIKEIRL